MVRKLSQHIHWKMSAMKCFFSILLVLAGIPRYSTTFSLDWSSKINASATCSSNQSFPCYSWANCYSKDTDCVFDSNGILIFFCSNEGKSYILSCYCLTFNRETKIQELGKCLYNCEVKDKYEPDIVGYIPLPFDADALNDAMCGSYLRNGTLCGECTQGKYMRVYSYDLSCINCGNAFFNVFKYLVVAYVPLTLFCFAIILFRINITSSLFHGFVFFCQVFTCPIIARAVFTYLSKSKGSAYIMTTFFGTLYGIWNLDFFRLLDLDICFRIKPLSTLSLDILVAVYPLLLIVFTYIVTVMLDNNYRLAVILLKPFISLFRIFKTNWDIKTSTVDAVVSFMYLSNVKFLSVCFDLLIPVQICSSSKEIVCRWAVFYDPTVPYFSKQHISYALLALLSLTLFFFAPVFLGITYSFKRCRKWLTQVPGRWQIALNVYMDSFQGCYKDGTEPGTRDCRWFSAVTFIVRFAIFSIYSFMIVDPFIPYCIMVLCLTALLTILADPYKAQYKHCSDHFVVFLLFLACTFSCALGLNYSSKASAAFYNIVYAIGLFHLAYICIVATYWIIRTRKFGLQFVSKIKNYKMCQH